MTSPTLVAQIVGKPVSCVNPLINAFDAFSHSLHVTRIRISEKIDLLSSPN
jgi:hypothetical protein